MCYYLLCYTISGIDLIEWCLNPNPEELQHSQMKKGDANTKDVHSHCMVSVNAEPQTQKCLQSKSPLSKLQMSGPSREAMEFTLSSKSPRFLDPSGHLLHLFVSPKSPSPNPSISKQDLKDLSHSPLVSIPYLRPQLPRWMAEKAVAPPNKK